MRDEGKTRFLDGLRVTREHLDHLQDTLLAGLIHLRQSIGAGKVCFGLKVQPADSKVTISPGVAFDRQARPLIVPAAVDLPVGFGEATVLYVVAAYALRFDLPVNGVPTILINDVKVETRAGPPPYSDDAVLFAELHPREGAFDVVQKGDWYLPPLDHGHSGKFLDDPARGYRYDGHPLGLDAPRFDSGFLPIAAGADLRLLHGLNTVDLLVQLQSRLPDATISSAGAGTRFWYELPGPQEIRVVRSADPGDLEVRVTLWPFGAGAAGPVAPVADAGQNEFAEFGQSFNLDGSRSRAFGGRTLIRYIWTQFS